MSSEHRLHAILADFRRAAEAGQAPDQQEMLARHPDLADELAAFFADHNRTHQLAAALHGVGEAVPGLTEAPTLAPAVGPPAAAPMEPGRYFGDYELLEEIARGGMGVVFKARQLSLNRLVALKMILAGQLASEQDVHRFRTEAEAVANLDHPHIVPIYEVGQHEGQHYFSMKLVDGGSLSGCLERFRGDLRAAARLLQTVARAVHYAHQRGILHRDLKPANILLDANGGPHVTDFGLAKRVKGGTNLTQSGAIVGTPSYIAPEQARAEKGLSTAVDTYSLGAILYELLTGRPPFQSATPLETILQVLEKEPQRPRALNPAVPPDLETVCLKCLEKAPVRRYPSAEALTDDLERWLRGEPILARPSTPAEQLWKWARRRPAVAALLAGLLAVTLGAIISLAALLQVAREHERDARESAERESQLKFQAIASQQQAEQASRAESAQRRKVESLLYFNRVALAHHYWLASNVGRAEAILDEAPQAQRHWEWRYLKRLCRPELESFSGGGAQFSPNGRWVYLSNATAVQRVDLKGGSAQPVLRVGDIRGLRNTVVGPGAGLALEGPWLSGDGKQIAVVVGHTNVVLADAETGQVHRVLPADGKNEDRYITACAFHPDGKRLAVASGSPSVRGGLLPHDLIVYDLTDGQRLLRLTAAGLDATFSADGKRLAGLVLSSGSAYDILARAMGGGAYALRVWDLESGRPLWTTTFGPPEEDDHGPVQFSANGKWVSSTRRDRVKLWDAATGKAVHTFEWPGVRVTAHALSRDGHTLAVAADNGTIRLWDTTSGQPGFDYRGHAGAVEGLQFHPEGNRLLSSGVDGTSRVWDVTRGQGPWALAQPPADTFALHLSDDHRWLATVRESGALLGSVIIEVRDLTTAQPARKLKSFPIWPGWVQNVLAFSRDGRLVAAEAEHTTIGVWETATGREVAHLKGHADRIRALAFHPDGRRLVSADDKGNVRLWELPEGRPLLVRQRRDLSAAVLCWSPDGQLLAVGGTAPEGNLFQAGGVQLWSAGSLGLARTFRGKAAPAHLLPVFGLAFSPDGRRLVSGSWDKAARIWEVASGTELACLRGHTNYIWAVTFSPDGRRVATTGNDKMLKIWDAETGQEILTFSDNNAVFGLSFSGDGQRLVAEGKSQVLVWGAGPSSASGTAAQEASGTKQGHAR
jgi:WD40 repeat protein